MKDVFYKGLTFTATLLCSWLLLSFYFFPLKLSAVELSDADVYFWESVSHMAPLKLLISLIFAIFSLFVYELRKEKRKKKAQEAQEKNPMD